MDQESGSHSFVVRIWIEEVADDSGKAFWRGHVTHIPDGARVYFQDLDDLLVFVARYLHASGVPLPPRLRLKEWVRQLRQRFDVWRSAWTV